MLAKLLFVLALATPILGSLRAGYPDCKGVSNSWPLIDQEPQLVSTVTNGKKFTIKSAINNTKLTIVAVKGSAYEMGYAYGQLLKTEINTAVPEMFKYLVDNRDDWFETVNRTWPAELRWMLKLPVTTPILLDMLLAAVYDLTVPYTPQRYNDELRGIADGSNFPLQKLIFANMFPELCQAHCSMAGIWGPASANGKLIQLRALDWDYRHVIAKNPLVTIYFPDEKNSNPFATFSFTAIIGAISGYSTKMGISEKVWGPSPDTLAGRQGEPFLYIMRDILQLGTDMNSAIKYLFDTPRTCRVHIGIGSKTSNYFQGVQMSYNELNIFNDKNYTKYDQFHPQMDGIMFWAKHEPVTDMCLASILQQNHGKINAELIYKHAVPLHETGNTQTAVYDFANDQVYIAYSDPDTLTKAFNRPLVKLDMKKLLDKKQVFGNNEEEIIV